MSAARPPAAGLFAFLVLATPLLAQQPPAPDYSRQPYVVEFSYDSTAYEIDGTSRGTLRTRVRIQSDAGVTAFGQLNFPYNSANQRLDVDTVFVRKPGGQIVATPASSVQDMTSRISAEAPVFSDLRVKVVPVTGLRPGDVLEYRVTWTTHTALAPGEFWSASRFDRNMIILDQRVVTVVPRSRPILVRTTGVEAPIVRERGDRRVYEWRHANLAIDTTLTSNPALAARRLQRTPNDVQLTTFRSWADVGRWYAGLEREREAVTPAIAARADSLVRGRATLADSVAALYAYVAQEFRYVSLSFGIGRFQPHAAAEVLANQYGDCKDKHTLLASMLRAIGVPSAPVLMATEGLVDSSLPSPHHFDHLITLVPAGRDTFWLDATLGYAPFRFLLTDERDQLVLTIPLDGEARLVRTPPGVPYDEQFVTTFTGTLEATGALRGTIRQTLRGDAEVIMRQLLRQVTPDRMDLFGSALARQQGFGGRVTAFAVTPTGEMAEPFAMSYSLDQPDAVSWSASRGTLVLPLPRFDLPATDTGTARDTVELDPVEQRHVVRVELPAGASPQLPAAMMRTEDFGVYRSVYRMEGRTLVAERSLRFTRRTLPPERGADFDALTRVVHGDENQTVMLLRPAGAPAVSATASVTELYEAGRRAYESRDYRAAVRSYRRVVVLEPRHADAWNELGRSYLLMNRPDSAASAFRSQIAVVPDHAYAHSNLGLALWRLGRHDQAAAAFLRQAEVNPLDRHAHAYLGEMYLEIGRDSAAVEALVLAAAIAPDDDDVHRDLGRAYLRVGRTDEALRSFERCLAIDPGPSNLNSVAWELAVASAALPQAEAWVRRAIDSTNMLLQDITLLEVGPREMIAAGSLSAYWDTMGWIRFRQGEVADAERWVRAAWLLGERPILGDHLGQILERLGRRQEAMRTYALALNARGDSVPGLRGRLERLAGGRAQASALVQQQHLGLQLQRTVRMPRALRHDGAGQIMLLFSPQGVVDMDFAPNAEDLAAADVTIRAARFPVVFPDSADIRIPRSGLLSCAARTGECTIVLTEGGVVSGTIRTVVPADVIR